MLLKTVANLWASWSQVNYFFAAFSSFESGDVTKHLMTGPVGNKAHCFPGGQSTVLIVGCMNAGCLKVAVSLYAFLKQLLHLIVLRVIKILFCYWVSIHSTVYGNKENYQLGDIVLMWHQIPKTYTKRDSWQSMRRINILSLVRKWWAYIHYKTAVLHRSVRRVWFN